MAIISNADENSKDRIDALVRMDLVRAWRRQGTTGIPGIEISSRARIRPSGSSKDLRCEACGEVPRMFKATRWKNFILTRSAYGVVHALDKDGKPAFYYTYDIRIECCEHKWRCQALERLDGSIQITNCEMKSSRLFNPNRPPNSGVHPPVQNVEQL